MNDFYTTTICNSPLFHSINSVRLLKLLEPGTRAAAAAIIADAAKIEFDLMITETYRSTERQEALYLQHATQLRTVGTHHFGLACDFAKVVNGEPSWKGDWSLLGVLARKHGLIWGGRWGDYDHVQRCAIDDQEKLFDGTWYPSATYDPYA